MDRQTRTGIAAAFMLIALILCALERARAQEDTDSLPRLGETTDEYEARMAGRPLPARPAAPTSMKLTADSGGHFFVDVLISSVKMRMLVDTGASIVALPRDDARRAGIIPQPPDFKAKVSTANGIVQVAPVVLKDLAVGELVIADVPAVVFPDNRLQVGLLGMSFLSKLSHFELAGRQLILQR